MWKWIVGILGAIVVLLVCAGFWAYRGYQKFTAGGNTATTSITGANDRVFAALANTDSMSAWMGSGTTVISDRHGVLAVGDKVVINSERDQGRNRSRMTWTVIEVKPNRLIAMEVAGSRNDSTPKVFATRRDSLVAAGDSTLIITTIASPAIDSARAKARDSSRAVAGAVLEFTSKIALSAFRLLSENQLKQLKVHIEQK